MSSNRAEPSLQEVSSPAGQTYLNAVRILVIQDYPCILSLIQGIIPSEMLEFEETVFPEKLGRRAGKFNDHEGNPSTISQTMNDYRESLIQSRMTVSKVNREEAILLLFPVNTMQTRERTRQTINNSVQALLGKLTHLWPREDISQAMQADEKLSKACEESDLISWHQAFLIFCNKSSGNNELNIKQAENKISRLRMKSDGYLEYVKEFKIAAENLRMCKSTFSEERIVALFFENLDQERFFHWYTNFLTEFHPLFLYKTKSLVEAMALTQRHYDGVIRATEKSYTKPEKQPKHDQSSQPSGHIMVTTTTNNNNNSNQSSKRKTEIVASNKSSKARTVEFPKSTTSTAKSSGTAPNGTITSIVCNKFSLGSCTYGPKCKFLHIKGSK